MPRISNDDWGRIQDLFDQLCDIAPARQQEELQKCGLSAPLQAELASLLAAHAMDGLLDGPIPAVSEDGGARYSSLEPGSQIGAFRIVSLVGRGGMGEVYEATHADGEFALRVAI